MITTEVVRACEKLYAKEMYQSWLWSVLGIAKRRGGAMLGSAELDGIYRYREQVVLVVDFLFGPGAAVACWIGERLALRLRDAFEGTVFVLALQRGLSRGVETRVGVSEALALMELRRSTQPVVDAILGLVRTEQALPLFERGGETSGDV